MAHIAEVTAVSTVRVFDDAGWRPVIPGAKGRKFLGKGVHGIGLILSGIIRISRKTPVIKCEQIIHTSVCAFSVVQVQQKSISVYLHLISRVLCVQRKGLVLFSIYYAHS